MKTKRCCANCLFEEQPAGRWWKLLMSRWPGVLIGFQFDHLKMFPRTAWEFCKWDRTDIVGFAFAMRIAFTIIGLLFLVVSIGA